MTNDQIKIEAANIAEELRPQGKKNIEEWEEYAIAVALKLIRKVNQPLVK